MVYLSAVSNPYKYRPSNYIDPERHKTHSNSQPDRQTDTRTDMPIADHTMCIVQQYDRLKN